MAALGFPRATNDVDYLVHGDFHQRTAVVFHEAGFRVFHSSDEAPQLTHEYPRDILFANRPLSRAILLRAERGPRFLGIPHLDAADIIGLKIQMSFKKTARWPMLLNGVSIIARPPQDGTALLPRLLRQPSYRTLTRGLPVTGFSSTRTGQSNTASTFPAVITSRGLPVL